MYQARREAGRLFGRCEHASLKVRPRTAPRPLLSKAPSTLERMSMLAAAFRTSTALGVGINVALTRWIRRLARATTQGEPARRCTLARCQRQAGRGISRCLDAGVSRAWLLRRQEHRTGPPFSR